MTFLSSCSATSSSCIQEVEIEWPIAGEKVGKELQKIPYQGYENFWEWLGRLRKTQLQLQKD
nr:MAG TPA: hypothetical protein [Caudoviricetes sp.]